MFLGKVVGTVWSTKKSPDLESVRFLVVHPYDLEKDPTRNIVIVADRLGAGSGEMVICAFGKAARTAMVRVPLLECGALAAELHPPRPAQAHVRLPPPHVRGAARQPPPAP